MRTFTLAMTALTMIACGGEPFTGVSDTDPSDGGGPSMVDSSAGCATTQTQSTSRLNPFEEFRLKRTQGTESCEGLGTTGGAGGEAPASPEAGAGGEPPISPSDGGAGGEPPSSEAGAGGEAGEPPVVSTDDCQNTGLRFQIEPYGGQNVLNVDISFNGPGTLKPSAICHDMNVIPQVFGCCLVSGRKLDPGTQVCFVVNYTNGSKSCDAGYPGCGALSQYELWNAGVSVTPEMATFPENCKGQACNYQVCLTAP